MDRGGDQLLGGGPLEDADDPADPAVDLVAAEPRIDHGATHGLEGQGAEPRGRLVSVEASDGGQSEADVAEVGGRYVPLAVVVGGEPEVSGQDLGDGEVGGGRAGVAGCGGGAPPGDDAVVFIMALVGAVGPEVAVPPVERERPIR